MPPAIQEKTSLRVLDIQRLSTEDGPGLRTTVFVKGCPLACAWCHNPESISPKIQPLWVKAHCMGCGRCVAACPQKGITLDETGQRRETEKCTGCAACGEACPTGANEVKGRDWNIEDLAKELLKDKVYFTESGGGITVSGGDPMQQARPVARLLQTLQSHGVSTALDSALLTTPEKLDAVLPYVDILLLDLKLHSSEAHQKWTGVPNESILENAKYVAARMRQNQTPHRLWLRTPIIPGATDAEENIRAIAAFIRENLADTFERWELCAFNNLCRDKYERLKQAWMFADTPLLRSDAMDALLAAARDEMPDNASKISWTGAVQLEEAIV